jgi:ABC-type polysaccharide/polyol phosphate export permease
VTAPTSGRAIVPSSSFEILRALVERSIRLRAKRSWLGAGWPAVAPILLLLLYVFVFKSVFHVGIPRYPQFLFTGLLPWTFLAQALPQAVMSISGEPELVRRSRFAYELLPISTVLVVGIYFVLTLLGLIGYLAVVGELVYSVLPAVILPVVALFFLVSSIAMLLALVDVYNRDLRMVLGNILSVWFFLVPIVYRPGMAPPAVRFLRSVDPMNMIVGQFRDILHFGQLSRPLHAVLMLAVCTGLLLVSRALFRAFGRDLPKDI